MVHNLEHYKNCYCNKSGGGDVVEFLEFPDEKSGVAHIFRQEILFMIRGSADISFEGLGAGGRVKKGEFVFLPAGSRVACNIAGDSAVLVVRIPDSFPECPVFTMNKTMSNVAIHRDPRVIHVLKSHRRIRSFISDLLVSLEDGFLCRHFLEGEANRLLYLITAYYSEQERVKFFSRILTPDIRFSEFVRINHMKYRTIADLSEALCMTPQAFSNRFKKVFGMTPHKWTQQEKARQIYLDICRSDMPLKEIAIKYDFPLSSNFFRFCKQTFGESPGSIRRNIHHSITPGS